MAQITITVPDALMPRIRQAFASAYGYQATIPDPGNPGGSLPNPETVNQFMNRKIREYIKEVVKGQEATSAGETARRTAAQQAETDIVLS